MNTFLPNFSIMAKKYPKLTKKAKIFPTRHNLFECAASKDEEVAEVPHVTTLSPLFCQLTSANCDPTIETTLHPSLFLQSPFTLPS